MSSQQDVLPLPKPAAAYAFLQGFEEPDSAAALSQSQKRRARQHRTTNRWLLSGLESLNEMSGLGDVSGPSVCTNSQRTVVTKLAGRYASVGQCCTKDTPLRAFQSLLGSKTGYGGDAAATATGSVATFRQGAVKFPQVKAGVRCLSDILPAPWSHRLRDGQSLLRNSEEVQHILSRDDRPRCAMDPVLGRRTRELGRFLSDLWRRDMIELGSDSDIPCGIFFVRRKEGLLRMIADPKLANEICSTPPYTPLPGSSSLGELECAPGEELWFASGDVDCCYFQYTLPPAVRALFGLPGVEFRYLDADVQLEPAFAFFARTALVPFRLRVPPMGWAWSVFLMQVGQHHVLRDKLGDAPWMVNHVPVPPLKAKDDTGPASVVPALYIDNYAAFSIDKSAARQAAGGMKQSLLDYGILSSFDPEADQVYLGFKLNRNEWRPTETKFWRVERSAQHVAFGNASFTGEEIEHFLGHCTHLLG